MEDWSDSHVDIDTYDPKKYLSEIRQAAEKTKSGVKPEFDKWLHGQKAEDWAKKQVHDLRSAYGKIGNAVRYGRYTDAANIWRGLGNEDKATEYEIRAVMAAGQAEANIQRGLGGGPPKGPIRRGL